MNNIVKNTKWYFFHLRHRSPLLIYIFYYFPSISKEEELPCKVIHSGSCLSNIVAKKSELEDLSVRLWKKVENNPKRLINFMNNAYKKHATNVAYWRKHYLDRDWSVESDKILIKEYNDFVKKMRIWGDYCYSPLSIEQQLTQKAGQLVGEIFKNSTEIKNVVFTPIKQSAFSNEKLSLCNLSLLKNKKDFDEQLALHLENFSFLTDKGFFLKFHDADYYLKRLQSASVAKSEIKKIDLQIKKEQRKFDSILKKIKNKKDKLFIQAVNESVFFRSWRTDMMLHSSYYVKELLVEMGKRLGLKEKNDLVYLLSEEVNKYLRQPRYKREIRKLIEDRKRGFIFIAKGFSSKPFVEQGARLKTYYKDWDPRGISSATGVINGQSVFKGVVKGKIVVVKNKQDYEKIKNYDVLVAHCTSPEMVPYMKNIKAIVTDEGGILCHAALISREMKKVAVIGTARATKVFKNGDVVEVDADNGVVRKI